MTKTLAAIMGMAVLIGCGDPGGGPSGGADASVTCRAPAGCEAILENGFCSYFCTSGSVCLSHPDGGLYDPRRAIALSEVEQVRIVNLRSDPMNCSACGFRCPAGAPTCSGGVCR